METDTEQMLIYVRKLAAAADRLNKQGVRCGQCMHLDHCAKNPTAKDKICLCFMCEVVQL